MSRPDSWTWAMTSAGGVPRALAMSRTLSWRRAAARSGLPVASVQPIIPLRALVGAGARGCRARRGAAGEAAVVVGDHGGELGLELDRVELAHALVLAGDDDVDAVGVSPHVLVEPVELDLELLGGEADGAEDAEAAGVGDGRHHVAAVGEGEDGELDAEAVADVGVHGVSCVSRVSWSVRSRGRSDRCGGRSVEWTSGRAVVDAGRAGHWVDSRARGPSAARHGRRCRRRRGRAGAGSRGRPPGPGRRWPGCRGRRRAR